MLTHFFEKRKGLNARDVPRDHLERASELIKACMLLRDEISETDEKGETAIEEIVQRACQYLVHASAYGTESRAFTAAEDELAQAEANLEHSKEIHKDMLTNDRNVAQNTFKLRRPATERAEIHAEKSWEALKDSFARHAPFSRGNIFDAETRDKIAKAVEEQLARDPKTKVSRWKVVDADWLNIDHRISYAYEVPKSTRPGDLATALIFIHREPLLPEFYDQDEFRASHSHVQPFRYWPKLPKRINVVWDTYSFRLWDPASQTGLANHAFRNVVKITISNVYHYFLKDSGGVLHLAPKDTVPRGVESTSNPAQRQRCNGWKEAVQIITKTRGHRWLIYFSDDGQSRPFSTHQTTSSATVAGASGGGTLATSMRHSFSSTTVFGTHPEAPDLPESPLLLPLAATQSLPPIISLPPISLSPEAGPSKQPPTPARPPTPPVETPPFISSLHPPSPGGQGENPAISSIKQDELHRETPVQEPERRQGLTTDAFLPMESQTSLLPSPSPAPISSLAPSSSIVTLPLNPPSSKPGSSKPSPSPSRPPTPPTESSLLQKVGLSMFGGKASKDKREGKKKKTKQQQEEEEKKSAYYRDLQLRIIKPHVSIPRMVGEALHIVEPKPEKRVWVQVLNTDAPETVRVENNKPKPPEDPLQLP